MTSYILNLQVFETNFFFNCVILFISFLPVLAVLISLNFLRWSPISSVPWFSKTVAPTRSSSQNLTKRYYSSRTTTKTRQVKASVVLPKEHEDSKLSPYFISGFYDGEGCFTTSIAQSKTNKIGWAVFPLSQIKLHAKDKPVLVEIKKFIGVGRITQQGPNAVKLRVQSFKELETIIIHFSKYPLLTKKRADYELLKKVLILIKHKKHLTPEGLRKIVALKAAMNLGLSDKLKLAFPGVVPAERPIVELPQTIDPHWLAGFTSAEGSFIIRAGFQVQLVFEIEQHMRDHILLVSFISFFNAGSVIKYKNASFYRVTKFDDIVNKIIPLFKKYKIRGVKALDFKDWCQVAELMKQKKYLTKEGLEEIRKIKAGINKGRKFQ